MYTSSSCLIFVILSCIAYIYMSSSLCAHDQLDELIYSKSLEDVLLVKATSTLELDDDSAVDVTKNSKSHKIEVNTNGHEGNGKTNENYTYTQNKNKLYAYYIGVTLVLFYGFFFF